MSKSQKAIVFGGAGFIGSHVADYLTENGYEVTIFDINASSYLKPDQKMVVGDITDSMQVESCLEDGIIVYNFAGIADLDEASLNPIGTIKSNILGNAIVLEALKNVKIQRYVLASTLYVYSKKGSFYRDSKVACELNLSDFSKLYGIPYSILRYGSVYGPRSNKKDRIYKFANQAIRDGAISYNGDGEEFREYIHVEDAARCSVEILREDCLNQSVIITGHQTMKIRDLAVMIAEILGEQVAINFSGETSDLHYDITPYSLQPRLGKKYISNYYIDLGEGILQCVENIAATNAKISLDSE